jgi:hypothetical protein
VNTEDIVLTETSQSQEDKSFIFHLSELFIVVKSWKEDREWRMSELGRRRGGVVVQLV